MDSYLLDTESLKKEVWALKKLSKTQGETVEEHQTKIEEFEKSALRYKIGYICVRVGSNTGQGFIDYQVTPKRRLRHEFGLVNCKNTITFDEVYNTLLWVTSTDASTTDSQSQRSTIEAVTTTNMTFRAGANVMTRFEVWGFIDD